ncbi:hypothetical protein PMSM_22895 [Paenibacillus macquariensis subsp. macquariensis]|nr:hypothetical protein PMSM_22895 [Paenibacillus macquariensis subsp. macquariensis]
MEVPASTPLRGRLRGLPPRWGSWTWCRSTDERGHATNEVALEERKRALYFAKAKYKEKSGDTLPNELDTAYVVITTKFWVSRGLALGIPLTKGDLGGWTP